ncbi:MAG: hypothetical protein AAGI68_14570 [Planctomycetota bacterium]
MPSSLIAQEGQGDEAKVVPPLTPDLHGLLTDPEVFAGQVTGDPVWTVNRSRGANSGGLELIQLPVAVGSVDGMAGVGEAGLKVSRSPVEIRGGRFVAWRLLEPKPEAPNAAYARREQARQASRSTTGGSAYTAGDSRRATAFLLDDLDERERRRPASGSGTAADPNAEPQGYLADLPDGAPQMMRQFTLKPGGRLAYELERRLPGMDFASGDSLYLILLDREKAEKLKPKRPERPVRQANASREQRQQAERRYRDELAKYRDEALAHRELMRKVLDLPDEFEVDAPPRIYMVMERQTRIDTLSFTGPDPLPWELVVADLEALRKLAGSTSRGGQQIDGLAAEQVLRRIAGQPHVFSQRIAARTILEGDLLTDARSGGLVENAALALIEGGDPMSQRLVALAAASVLPPNSVSANVLTAAATGELADLSLASLEARISVDAGGTEPDVTGMVRTASDAAIDPKGPDPRRVMNALFGLMAEPSASRRSHGSATPAEHDAALLEAAKAFRFEAVPTHRRAGVIEGIIEAAPSIPLAAYWLDQTLLQSDEPAWVEGTLQALADTRIAAADPTGQPPEETGADQARVVVGEAIHLEDAEHGLIRALRSPELARRELAWAALGPFDIQAGSAGGPRNGSAPDPGLSLFKRIVADAIELEPTPPAVVAFAANQTGEEGTDALVSLMLFGDTEASRSAVVALIGSDRDITPWVAGLDAATRQRFADGVVAAAFENADAVKQVTGLMRQPTQGRSRRGGPAGGFGTDWFCGQVSAGDVPGLDRWVDQAVGRGAGRSGSNPQADASPGPINAQPLLELTTTPDLVLAEAALTALTLAVGGDATDADQIRREAMALPERSTEIMAEFWRASLVRVISSRLDDAEGPYRLFLRVDPPESEQPEPASTAPPPGGNRLTGTRSLAQRLTERAAQSEAADGQNEDAAPPPAPEAPAGTVIDLGVLPFTLTDTGQPSLGVDGLNLSAPEKYLAIRLNDVSTLKSFGRPEISQLPIGLRDDMIDLVPVEQGKWRGGLTLDDGQRLTLELVPEAE